MRKAILCLLLFSVSPSFAATSIRALTLNLHGFHPTNEAPRYLESRQGITREAPSRIFYFSPEELARGHKKRLDLLGASLQRLSPDFVFLQEVGAASFTRAAPNCSDFYKRPQQDLFEKNSALRLLSRLPSDYRAALACRGNVGWWTTSETFAQERVIKKNNRRQGSPHSIVFDFGANPYPNGLLIEGLALLVKKPWEIRWTEGWSFPTATQGEHSFAQATLIELPNSGWVLAVNIHAPWDFSHFEHAVAVRRKIDQTIGEMGVRSSPFLGVLIAGDFNAELYRGKSGSLEASPWEMKSQPDFDWVQAQDWEIDQTFRRHFSQKEIFVPAFRFNEAMKQFLNWRRQAHPASLVMQEALDQASRRSLCLPEWTFQGSCYIPQRIDHLFFSGRLQIQNSSVLYSHHDWMNLENTLSDHPAVIADFDAP